MSTQITTITPAEMPADELALAVREYRLAKLPAEARVAIQIGEDDIIARGDELLTDASQITAVTDKATRAQAHATGQALIKLRTEVERKAKALRDRSNEHSKACIAAEKRLVARTKPAEDAVILLRDQYDAAEKTRKAAHEEAIRAISARAILPPSMPSAELRAAIDATRSDLAGREWEEYTKQAKAAADATLAALEVTLALSVAREEAEAKARAEAESAEAERLAREAAEREAREAAEREAARVAGLKAALVDLELGIARRIRAAVSPKQAQALVAELGQEVDGEGLDVWAEFAGDAAEIVRAGHADAVAHLERLEAVAAAEARAAADRAAREAAEREAAAVAAEKAAVEREEREAAERRVAEVRRRPEQADAKPAAASTQAIPSLSPTPPRTVRWGELCAALSHEIPPWVLEQLGCQSEAGSYTVDALRSLRASLGDICARLDAMISE